MTVRRTGRIDPILPKAGIGLRAAHHAEVVETHPGVGWFEAHAENYMGRGIPFHYLSQVRRTWPVSLHGVGLSIGSADGLDRAHLARIADLVQAIEPVLVSEHLSWSTCRGAFLNDLLPLPYTGEMLDLVAHHVDEIQATLRRQVLIENPSIYLRYTLSTIAEGEFFAELVRRTGCGILCDVNNLYVNQRNHGSDPLAFLDAIPAEAVGEIHLAGHHVADHGDITILIDDHGSPVSEPVWDLYEQAIARAPAAATLIEWDCRLPSLDILVGQARLADEHRSAVLGARDVIAA